MDGSRNFEPTKRTFVVHKSTTGRRTRIYRPRPSRQVVKWQSIRDSMGTPR